MLFNFIYMYYVFYCLITGNIEAELSRYTCLLRVTLVCDRYVIAELIETEKDYVKDLGMMVEVGTGS